MGDCRAGSQVVELILVYFNTDHKVMHTVSGSQLFDDYTQHLIPTSEYSDFLIPRVLLSTKRLKRYITTRLSKISLN